MNYMHEESRAVIVKSLRSAAARSLTDKAILVDFVDQDCPFDFRDPTP